MTEAPPIALTSPLAQAGVRPRLADDLAAFGLRNVGQLIAHLPARHEMEHAETPIEDLVAGEVVSARGEVTATRLAGFGKRQRFEAVIKDETGRLDLVWFNAPYLRGKIGPGPRSGCRAR